MIKAFMRTKKYIARVILFLGCICVLSGCGYRYTAEKARADAEEYIAKKFQSDSHSVEIVEERIETHNGYQDFYYVCRTDDNKYSFEINPYLLSYEVPFAFTVPFIKVKHCDSHFAKTIIETMTSDEVFEVSDLSDETLLRVVEQMHFLAQEVLKEKEEYGANDYPPDSVSYEANLMYAGEPYTYFYSSSRVEKDEMTDMEIVERIKKRIDETRAYRQSKQYGNN